MRRICEYGQNQGLARNAIASQPAKLSVCLQLPRGTVQKRWNYEARQDTQMEQMEIYDLKACAAGAARELQPVWDASTYPEKSSNGQ